MAARSCLVLLLLGVLTLACGGGGGGGNNGPTAPAPPTASKIVVVEIVDSGFVPRSVMIDPGDTVRWVLRGSLTTHTVTAKGGPFDSGFTFAQPGATFERVFPVAENGRTFEYSCVTHQGCCQMQGSVRVGNNTPPPSPGYE